MVIAAKDIEAFIEETVRSILAQDFDDWQLILVIDSATDGTAGIAHSLASGEPRIRVIEGKFGGVSLGAQRRIGIV